MQVRVLEELNVSRETFDRLSLFADLLTKWNAKINLVARSTVAELWARHIEDSAQLLLWAPARVDHWLDLGSGGGLPGLVVGVVAKEGDRIARLTLVESDLRKCAFLREAARLLDLDVEVKTARIESIPPQSAQVVSARALASLSTLFDYAEPHLTRETTLLLPKGASHDSEIEVASKGWDFTHRLHPSRTDAGAAIVEVRDLIRKRTKETP